MADSFHPQGTSTTPSTRTSGLEVVREHEDEPESSPRPHCDEHFLFTKDCADCQEASRRYQTKAKAEPAPGMGELLKPAPPSNNASRSFGFTDSFPRSLVDDPPDRYYGPYDLLDDALER